jgi:hypothetical protein
MPRRISHEADFLPAFATAFYFAAAHAQVGSVPPKWVIVTQDRVHTDYVDVANITRSGDMDHGQGLATIWVVQDFHNFYNGKRVPMGTSGKEFLSIKFQVEIQCTGGPNSPARGLFYATYSGHMGSGLIVDSGPQISPWDKKVPHEVESFACTE